MELRLGLPQLPILISFIISLTVFIIALVRARERSMFWLVLLFAALTQWSAAYLLQISTSRLPLIFLFSNFAYLGISLVPVFYLLFALSFARSDRLRNLRLLPWLLIVPLIIQIAVWSPALHPLFFSGFEQAWIDNLLFIQHSYGPLFWLHTVYSYALLLTGTGIFLHLIFNGREPLFGRAAALIGACLVPLLGNVVHLAELNGTLRFVDITPVGFSISGVLLLFAMLRYHLADYVPVTHKLILSNLKEGIMVLDHESRLVELNSSAEKLFKYSHQELIGRYLFDLVAENREHLQSFANVYDAAGETDLVIRGVQRSFEYSISPITDRRLPSPGRLVVLREITERRLYELQAAKAERLDAMELLAGGVAHDFNNLLSAIVGNLSLAKLENRDSIVEEYLRQAENATTQAARLTRQLLSFSSRGCPEAESSSLSGLVSETVSLFLRGSGVACSLEIDDELWNLYVDPRQIVQVLNNLVVNTKQALPQGGTLRVRAENRELSPGNWLDLDPGRYVHVLFQDNGPGIAAEMLPRIFDPYYTTKTEGSGLGLAVSRSIVRSNGGTLYADPGPGGIFHLYLPAVQEADFPLLESVRDHRSLEELKVAGLETLVLMDDDRDVRLVLTRILSLMGYRVHAFASADQVLRFLTSGAGAEVQAIIADLTVPGGGGACDLMESFEKLEISLPVVVASGYADREAITDFGRFGFVAAIVKPFTPENLHTALGAVSPTGSDLSGLTR